MARLVDLPLRAKIVLILSGVVLAYGALDALIQRFVVYDSFVRLEERQAARDAQRVRDAIQTEVRTHALSGSYWTTADEAGRFVSGQGPDTAHASLDEGTVERDQLDLLVLCQPSGKVLWSRALKGCEETSAPRIEFHDFPNESLALSHPLLMQLDPAQPARSVSGLLETEHGHLLVCARWMLGTEGGAEPRGLVVIGRLLTPAWQASLARQTGVEFTLAPVLEALARESDRAAFDEATAGDAPVVRLLDGQHLRTLARMTDISEAPGLMIETRSRRAISSSGATALRYALVSTVAAGLLMMLALLFLLTRAVLEPLARLTAHAVEIGRTEELTHRLELQRAD